MDRVRTLILDWAIALEGAGILGEGISFTVEEREKAAKAGPSVQITNYGHLHQGNVTGDQNKTLVHSSDTSTNILSGDIFEQLTQAVGSKIENCADREALLELIKNMKNAKGSKAFQGLYQRFVSVAATYMTILGPFLPALTEHLPHIAG